MEDSCLGRAADPLPFQAPQFAAVAFQTDAHLQEKGHSRQASSGGADGPLCGGFLRYLLFHWIRMLTFLKSETCSELNIAEQEFYLNHFIHSILKSVYYMPFCEK